MTTNSKHPETLALHGGTFRKDPTTNAIKVPIYQTTAFEFDNAEHASNLFALKELGNIYTRIMNPTNDALEQRVAAIEGGAVGLTFSSGSAATATAIQNLARAGDNIVSSTNLYGGTWNLFANTLRDQGIEVRFADPSDPENFKKLTDDKTRAYFGETLPNPSLSVFPIKEVADIGRPLGIPLIIDNTAAPLNVRPFDHGAAIIVHSLTKWIGGHGSTMGGIIIDGGNFDWTAVPERQPFYNEPDPSYHGAIWGTLIPEALGAPIAYAIRARVVLLRDIGASLAPQNAFNILQGLESLPLRLKQHNENAVKVAEFLKSHKAVGKVIFPKFAEGLDKERADKYLSGGYGSMIGIELNKGVDGGKAFIDALELHYHCANIGDARSLAIHPASTTHSQLSPEDQLKAGVTPGYIRLCVGIEHADDIIADLEKGLTAADNVEITVAAE
jgi:O-acetylhomoserine (thiol)-lyase